MKKCVFFIEFISKLCLHYLSLQKFQLFWIYSKYTFYLNFLPSYHQVLRLNLNKLVPQAFLYSFKFLIKKIKIKGSYNRRQKLGVDALFQITIIHINSPNVASQHPQFYNVNHNFEYKYRICSLFYDTKCKYTNEGSLYSTLFMSFGSFLWLIASYLV